MNLELENILRDIYVLQTLMRSDLRTLTTLEGHIQHHVNQEYDTHRLQKYAEELNHQREKHHEELEALMRGAVSLMGGIRTEWTEDEYRQLTILFSKEGNRVALQEYVHSHLRMKRKTPTTYVDAARELEKGMKRIHIDPSKKRVPVGLGRPITKTLVEE